MQGARVRYAVLVSPRTVWSGWGGRGVKGINHAIDARLVASRRARERGIRFFHSPTAIRKLPLASSKEKHARADDRVVSGEEWYLVGGQEAAQRRTARSALQARVMRIGAQEREGSHVKGGGVQSHDDVMRRRFCAAARSSSHLPAAWSRQRRCGVRRWMMWGQRASHAGDAARLRAAKLGMLLPRSRVARRM